jgi:cellulose synthase/poly-beta-1,6-N-acetylglucosamine synthase-like glycosyltransferase
MDWINSAQEYLPYYRHEIIYFSYAILVAGVLQTLFYLVQIPLAALELGNLKLKDQEQFKWALVTSDVTIPISILIPAYNEELSIVNTVRATMATEYPDFEVIVINDGSIDKTLKALIQEYDLQKSSRFYEEILEHNPIKGTYQSAGYPNLIVIDKENGGKSDALNAGLNIARNDIFCTLDADSLLDQAALLETIYPFIEYPDHVVATGGTVRIINGCKLEHGVIRNVGLPKNIIALFQIVEYIRAFLIGRLAFSKLKIVTIISGAFAVFKRDIAIKTGGFSKNTIGEDYELVTKFHKYCVKNKPEYIMKFVPEPVCWTEVPEDLKTLKRQRVRWQQGALQVFFKHREAFMNPAYKRFGLIAMPILFLFDIVGPIMELMGLILLPIFFMLGALNYEFMLAFLCLFFIFGVFISVMSLVLEEMSLKRYTKPRDLLILGLCAVIENFGYRQLNTLWRIMGWFRFLFGRNTWGKMRRVGANKS